MKFWMVFGTGIGLFAFAISSAAHAEGIGAEANYSRADGHWGGEFGAGYAMSWAGFSLTPGAGVFVREGSTRAYGRVEATYTLPASATFGAGVRVSSARTRVYGTLAVPILPKVALKGNVGSKYYSAGLMIGY